MHLTLLSIVHTNISIKGERKNTFPCTKLSMRNGRCVNRLCARAPRARQGSCQIWYESIPRRLSIRNTFNMANVSITERAQTCSCTR